MFLLLPAYPGSPGQKAVNGCVCVCVCVCVCARARARVYITTTTKMQLIVAECSHMYHDTVSTENAITPSLNYAVPRLVNGCQCL